jgi:DNA gyrase subunit A
MSILKHVEITPEQRDAYLRAAGQTVEEGGEISAADSGLSEDDMRRFLENEQILLSVTNGGFGKRTSAYEYRVSGRGGQGVTNMNLTKKNGGEVVAAFPVTDDHQIMLVSDRGQLIRTLVKNVRITGRVAQGVTVFKVAKGENVVSVAWLIEEDEDEQGDEALVEVEADEEVEEAVSDETETAPEDDAPLTDE